MVRVYPFVPLVIAGFAFLLNIDIRRASDYFAPVPLMIFGVSHIGCVWGNCCYTFIESDFGIYNKMVNKTLFPNQLLEAALAIATAVLLILLLTKRKYDMGGKAMGYMLILYGIQRFLLEFIRDNQKIIFNISELAFWALASIIVGVIFNIFIQDRSNKHEKSI